MDGTAPAFGSPTVWTVDSITTGAGYTPCAQGACAADMTLTFTPGCAQSEMPTPAAILFPAGAGTYTLYQNHQLSVATGYTTAQINCATVALANDAGTSTGTLTYSYSSMGTTYNYTDVLTGTGATETNTGGEPWAAAYTVNVDPVTQIVTFKTTSITTNPTSACPTCSTCAANACPTMFMQFIPGPCTAPATTAVRAYGPPTCLFVCFCLCASV